MANRRKNPPATVGGVDGQPVKGILMKHKPTSDRLKKYPRAKILWDNVPPSQISRFLGITFPDRVPEARIKAVLRNKKVWPYYYPLPGDPTDTDRFPTELVPSNHTKAKTAAPVSGGLSSGRTPPQPDTDEDRISNGPDDSEDDDPRARRRSISFNRRIDYNEAPNLAVMERERRKPKGVLRRLSRRITALKK